MSVSKQSKIKVKGFCLNAEICRIIFIISILVVEFQARGYTKFGRFFLGVNRWKNILNRLMPSWKKLGLSLIDKLFHKWLTVISSISSTPIKVRNWFKLWSSGYISGVKEHHIYIFPNNVSSVVEFIRWWVIKCKIFCPRINMLKGNFF